MTHLAMPAAEHSVAPSSRPILILAAMTEEIDPLRAHVEPGETIDVDRFVAQRGRLGQTPVVLARTGEGRARAAAADVLLDRFHPRLVVVVGIAGALSPTLQPGDLVVADEVRDSGEPIAAPDADWVSRALRHANTVAGTAISTSRILCTAAEKAEARLGQPEDRPATVDLESAAFARAAVKREIPYLILRAVSDAADEELPLDLNRCRDRDGGIRRLAVVGRALVHPSSVRGLWRLRRRLYNCAHELAGWTVALIDGDST